MAEFGSKDLDSKVAFLRHMSKLANDKNVLYKVIEYDDQVVGNVGNWMSEHRKSIPSFVSSGAPFSFESS